MVIAILTALYMIFFVGSPTADLSAQLDRISVLVADHIADEERVAQVQSVLQEMRTVQEEFETEILRLHRQALEMDADYTSAQEDYDRMFTLLDEAWMRSERRIVTLRFQMLGLMTRQEWDAVFGALDGE